MTLNRLWPVACTAFALSCQQANAAPTQLYVSPTGTGTNCSLAAPCSLTDGRAKVRTLNAAMTGNVIVNLRGGTYALTSTFDLNQLDSGSNGYAVIYRNYPGETPVLSGGRNIAVGSWQLHDAAKNIWKATVTNANFRQIYVNSVRAVRARQPNLTDDVTGGPYYTAISPYPFKVNASEAQAWSGLNDVEVVWLSHWLQKRTRIASYATSGSETVITFRSEENTGCSPNPLVFACGLNHTNQITPATPYYFENAYDMLDAAGEWFLDRAQNTLYYKPRAGENMATVAVTVPNVTTLIKIEGTLAQPAHHIQVRGLTLRYTNWDAPSSAGYINSQAGFILKTNATVVPGALIVREAADVSIEGNVFNFTGAHGILTGGTLARNRIVGNHLSDLSGGGIYEGPTNSGGASNSTQTLISGNLVEKIGRHYTDTVGIFATTPNHMTIEFNEVRLAPYTGISIGWRWDELEIGANHNVIRNNRIHQVMRLHDDGAGIYSLGSMQDSFISDNHISDIAASAYNGSYPIAAIYLDNGSRYKVVSGNVIDSTIKAFYARNPTNRENAFLNNFHNVPLGPFTPDNATNGVNTEQDNELVSGAWPVAAQTIMAGAGLVANEAVNKPASAMSSFTGFLPAGAVNDSTDEPGWASPDGTQRFYWQVDLQSAKRIKKVEVVSRLGAVSLDNPAERMNFEVWASNSPAMTPGTYVILGAVGGTAYPFHGTWSLNVSDTLPYRYLALVKKVNQHFYLNEVRIYR